MAAVVVALVALTAWTGAAGGARPTAPPVLVPRCCPEGASLAPDTLALDILTREDASAACRPDNAPAPWAPRVYAPALRKYLGKVPSHWRVEHGVLPECDELRVLREHPAPYAFLANTASLQVPGPPPAALPPRRYCADAAAALACAEELPPAGGGAAKCCPASEALNGGRCVPAPAEGARALAVLRQLGNGSAVRVGWPACTRGLQYAEAGSLKGAEATADGALELAAGGGRLARGAWCADAAVGADEARLAVMECDEAARARRPSAAPAHHAVYGVGLAVGAAFLAATLAAGFALPAAHHALHWRCQTHYVAALMVGDVLLATTQLAGDAVPPPFCRALAICMHFLFLSAFFWLNTMCFNIWWTFRDFRPTSLERGQEVWRLRVYMVYAWGGPLALAGTAAALDAAPPAAALLRPRFGERHCWFYGDLEVLVYFFGPVGLLLLVNLALFASTTRQLTCGLWRRDEVKSTSERAALGRVCGKLVVVMGVTWVADVVSWAAGGPHAVWYATDLLNALQGLLIFLVVGCQPHAWAALRGAARALAARACPCCGCRAAPAPPTHSSTHLPSCGESLTHTTQAPAPPAPAAPAAPAQGPPKLPMETVC